MRAATLVALALASLTACSGRSAPARKDAGPAAAGDAGVLGPVTRVLPPIAPAQLLPEPQVPMPSQLHFRLLDAGAGPRRALRYQGRATARELVATARITSKLYDGRGGAVDLALAPLHDGFGISSEARRDQLVVHLRGLPGAIDPGADARPTEAARAYLGRWRTLLEGKRIDVAIDARGQLAEVTLLEDPTGQASREARDELVQRWLGLAVPLPEEAIGIGARWRVVTLLRTGGAVLKQNATYQLDAIDGETWTVTVELERLGEHQDIRMPELPAGVTAELVALRRVTRGTLVLGPDGPLPRTGELAAESVTHARLGRAGAPPQDQVTEDRGAVTLSRR